MSKNKIFVGRKAELEQFKKVLTDPKGQAIVIIGQAGMGKTWLINKMAEIAQNNPALKCGCVQYEVTPTDSVDSTMALMVDNAFEAGQVTENSFDGTTQRLEQWRSFLNVFNIGDLVMSLRRDIARHTRDQFIERLRLISGRMPKNGRAIFIIDPEKYMQEKSDQTWAIVVKELPDKIKFVFAQRPEDVLVESETFCALTNVVYIPDERLDVLDEEAVDELLNIRIESLEYSITDVRKVLNRYNGHPYALGAALDLLEAKTKLEKLPKKPESMKFAIQQWGKMCEKGDEAIKLFEAYAILEIGVPDDVAEAVSGVHSTSRKRLQTDKYLRGLIREEGYGRMIYHAILADYILEQIEENEKKEYHSRAVEVYRGKLKRARDEKTKPDELSLKKLSKHVLVAEGETAFVDSFVNECTKPLLNLGLLDAAINLSKLALIIVNKDPKRKAILMCNLGFIYQKRGDLAKAEQMLRDGLKINEKLEDLEGMAPNYCNLGLIYQDKGELDKAEQMYNKSLEIAEKFGHLEGMSMQYGNLGTIYGKRGDLLKAEQMFQKSLEINEKLGLSELIAKQYGNLGEIYRKSGQLDKAEQMLRKALQINEKVGLMEELASCYDSLGVIFQIRGDLANAEQMHLKSIEIAEKLDLKKIMASGYGNLGLVYQKRVDLVKSEQMLLKSLEINEKLGRLDGMAIQYANLGSVYERQGDDKKAIEYFEKALEIFKKVGMEQEIKEVQGWIKELYKKLKN